MTSETTLGMKSSAGGQVLYMALELSEATWDYGDRIRIGGLPGVRHRAPMARISRIVVPGSPHHATHHGSRQARARAEAGGAR